MQRVMKTLVSVGMCGMLHVTAQAAGESPFGLGIQASTVGVGPVLTYSPVEWFSLRGDFGWLKLDQDVTAGSSDYVVAVDYASGGVLADLYPFGGPLRLTVGARFGDNAFAVESQVEDAWDIGGVIYPTDALDSVSGTVTFDDNVVPYVGFGFGNPDRAERLIMMLDVGVVFQSATVELQGEGAVAETAAFQSALAAEEADLQEELDTYELYPVITFVLGYRF